MTSETVFLLQNCERTFAGILNIVRHVNKNCKYVNIVKETASRAVNFNNTFFPCCYQE